MRRIRFRSGLREVQELELKQLMKRAARSRPCRQAGGFLGNSRRHFKRPRSSLNDDAIQEQLDAERLEHVHSSCRTDHIEWEQTCSEAAARLDADKLQHSSTLEQERRQHGESLDSERLEWEQARKAQQSEVQVEIARQLEALQGRVTETHAALDTDREAMDAQRREWGDDSDDATQRDSGRARAVLEKRIRFQQEHLEKLRSDLEKAQNEHRRERQYRSPAVGRGRAFRWCGGCAQMDMYRSSIDEREKSLERERFVLEKIATSIDQQRRSGSTRHYYSRRAECLAGRTTEFSPGPTAAAAGTVHVAHGRPGKPPHPVGEAADRTGRHAPLDARNATGRRRSLELELAHHAGQDVASVRRSNRFAARWSDTTDNCMKELVEQRREHLEIQTKFERMRAEFHDERQKLMEWIANRDQELPCMIGEERLRSSTADAAVRDTSWQEARNRWMQEKTEAEQVIRKLLGELGQSTSRSLAGNAL